MKDIPYSVYNSSDLIQDLSKSQYKRILKDLFSYCIYCESDSNLTIDHVVPRSKGGTEKMNNLVVACFDCNQQKGSKDLEVWYPQQASFDPIALEFILAWNAREFVLGL
jgi:5-methylcytosine-specific restriction endonuclease McrA